MEGSKPSEPLVSSLMEQHHHLLHLEILLRCATGCVKSQGPGCIFSRLVFYWWKVFQKRNRWGGFCCPVLPPNRAYRLCSNSEHLRVIVGTCKVSPMTAEQYRAKSRSLPCVSSLFRPHSASLEADGGDAGHCPRVHNTYFIYRLSP